MFFILFFIFNDAMYSVKVHTMITKKRARKTFTLVRFKAEKTYFGPVFMHMFFFLTETTLVKFSL